MKLKGAIFEGNSGRYAILDEGGAGTVYKGRCIKDGTPVAVKILHSKKFEINDVQKERFTNEIDTLFQVKSNHIVSAIDRGHYQNIPFLVMEWMSDGTLEEMIAKRDYGTNEIISISAQLLKAFCDLQTLGFVHRDLKPNNVLLNANFRIKLSDLGLIKNVNDPMYLTGSDARIGSLFYVSERQRNEPVKATSRDDFFSLSLILYELVSRRRIHNRNIPLSVLRPNAAPVALCNLIDRAMQDYDDWQSTFQEMCHYINLEKETISDEYTGSVLIPEFVVQKHINTIYEYAEDVIDMIDADDLDTSRTATLLNDIVAIIVREFHSCTTEFHHCGVTAGISDELDYTETTLYLYASFTGNFSALY